MYPRPHLTISCLPTRFASRFQMPGLNNKNRHRQNVHCEKSTFKRVEISDQDLVFTPTVVYYNPDSWDKGSSVGKKSGLAVRKANPHCRWGVSLARAFSLSTCRTESILHFKGDDQFWNPHSRNVLMEPFIINEKSHNNFALKSTWLGLLLHKSWSIHTDSDKPLAEPELIHLDIAFSIESREVRF